MKRDDFMVVKMVEDYHDANGRVENRKNWYEVYRLFPNGSEKFVGHIDWSPYGSGPDEKTINRWIDSYIEDHFGNPLEG